MTPTREIDGKGQIKVTEEDNAMVTLDHGNGVLSAEAGVGVVATVGGLAVTGGGPTGAGGRGVVTDEPGERASDGIGVAGNRSQQVECRGRGTNAKGPELW